MVYRSRKKLLAVALMGATAMSAPALAQTTNTDAVVPTPTVPTPANPSQVTPEQAPEVEQATAEGGEIVVTGFRQSYANAIAAKRNQVAITDGISSDGLGRFPDLNVGEALQRVPGVQINREAEGRNATINLRGLPGEYARLTLNGVAFAEPILNDAAPLGAFNSDIFSGIVVDKSPLANAQSGGLSGNVDLQIAPALGRKDGGFAKLAYEHNELGSRGSPAATLGYNHHVNDDFAVFGVLAYKREFPPRFDPVQQLYRVHAGAGTGQYLYAGQLLRRVVRLPVLYRHDDDPGCALQFAASPIYAVERRQSLHRSRRRRISRRSRNEDRRHRILLRP